MSRPKSSWPDHVVGAALGSSYVAALLLSVSGLGYSRDEGFYFQAASSYAAWFQHLLQAPSEALTRGAIDSAWNANHEHPALVKSLFALSWLFLHKKWQLFGEEGTAFRFGGMVFAGIGVWLLYLWGTRFRSRGCGFMAAALFALMPRVFYHSHLDCFDVPITVMWLACAYAYWRAVDTGTLRWAIATGVVFGLALETKHNAWFLPFALVVHNLIARFEVYRRDVRRGFFPLATPLLAMATLGPLVFVALWPWLWADTADRFGAYFRFHLNHDYYNIVYLGQTYWKPPFPWSYIWVMTAATVPTITLVLFAIGASRVLFGTARLPFRPHWPLPMPRRGDSACTGWLWALGIASMFAPWVLSRSTPIFGGTKHWMPAYPFLCLFAGVGFDWLAGRLSAWCAHARGWQGRWRELGAHAAFGGIPPARAPRRDGALASLGAFELHSAGGWCIGRRDLGTEPSILGIHDRRRSRLPERAGQAGGFGLHPRHRVAIVGNVGARWPAARARSPGRQHRAERVRALSP